MATIDITTMRGEMPRVIGHLLPESNSTLAQGCHFGPYVLPVNRFSTKIPLFLY
ncbi:hypothetical protein HC231_10100 [Brenneria izadpanahii]|uniref:Uncharacterized protein n=1 Tax=Brenneria izadpanahii TaxID=2722756 RepID=A0ABX7UNQ8_9GAMM|nr:hypothetical protein HC231_10100 [Brenneria izadpanahii]